METITETKKVWKEIGEFIQSAVSGHGSKLSKQAAAVYRKMRAHNFLFTPAIKGKKGEGESVPSGLVRCKKCGWNHATDDTCPH